MDHYVTPDGGPRSWRGRDIAGLRLQTAIDLAGPGDTIHVLPGVYDEPVLVEGKRASARRPITIRSDDGATLDGRRSVLRPPSIDGLRRDTYAFVKIIGSQGIVLEGMTIQNAWPTAIYVESSCDVTVRRMSLNGATFGIFARGETTERITIERCSWIQHTDIWDRVLWKDIHLSPLPRRELDGDFFRSFDIRGNLIVRNNFIAHAFNGIHLFASVGADSATINRDVWIYRNTFAFIRDSAVEAEYTARNWWVFENKIYNCHTWFAFEMCRGGDWYVFSNRGWFDRKPGPPGDCNSGGGVVKTNKIDLDEEDLYLPERPFYVFHNSWYTRSAYAKKGKLRHFRHFANAIEYARAENHPAGVVDTGRRMFGVGAPEPACDGPAAPEAPFTNEWSRLDIAFANDVCNHPDYPVGLRAAGYPVVGVHAAPGFVAGRDGEFSLLDASPCRGAAEAHRLTLPDGREWVLPPGLDVGAMNGTLPLAPDDLGCPRDVLPADYVHEPEA